MRILAWKYGEAYDRPQGGGVLHAAVAPAGAPFGPPEVIEDHVFALAAAGGARTGARAGRPHSGTEPDAVCRASHDAGGVVAAS